MPVDPGFINASAGAPAYGAAELRRLYAVEGQYSGRVFGARQGVRPGGNALETSIAGSTITVRAGLARVDPGLTTTQGPYLVALEADETHTLDAAHATLPRKDITVLRVYDHDEDSSGNRFARSEYLAGAAAGSPAEPAVPAGAMRLATIDVPSVANGGPPVVTINFPWSVAAGGIVPVRTQAERDALSPYDGAACYRRDRDWIEVYDGAAWRVCGVAVASSSADLTAAVTNPFTGQVAWRTDLAMLQRWSGSAWVGYPDPPTATLRQTSVNSPAPANNAWTAIQFGTEDDDSAGGHDNATNNTRYTAQRAGLYELSGAVCWNANATGQRWNRWAKNGTEISGSGANMDACAAGQTLHPARTIQVPLAVSDYVELQGLQSSGGALDTYVGVGYAQSTMTAKWLKP